MRFTRALLLALMLSGCGFSSPTQQADTPTSASSSVATTATTTTAAPPSSSVAATDLAQLGYPGWLWADGDDLFEADLAGTLELDAGCAYVVDDFGRDLLILPASDQTTVSADVLMIARNSRTAGSADYEPGIDMFAAGDAVETAGAFGEGKLREEWPDSCDYSSIVWTAGVWRP